MTDVETKEYRGLWIIVFFADEHQCAEWDAQLLAKFPNLKTDADQTWHTKPGWRWFVWEYLSDWWDPDREALADGACETAEECYTAATEAIDDIVTLNGMLPEDLAVFESAFVHNSPKVFVDWMSPTGKKPQ